MKYETLEFKRDGAVGILTVNRPQAMNALNAQVLKDLALFLQQLNESLDSKATGPATDFEGVRALIITGSGEKAFVAGADIKEMEAKSGNEARSFAQNGQSVFQQIEDLRIPTIAAVNGFALGGGLELALSCDFILASKNARLGLPEVSLGLIPGYGGTQRLSRHCGKNIARLFALTGDMYPAEQCATWGLVVMVTEPQDLLPKCLKMAGVMAARSPHAVKLAKKAIHHGYDETQEEGMHIEAELFHQAFNSEDKKEGVRAFVEKRTPNFTGK